MKARKLARINQATSNQILASFHPETQAYRIIKHLLNNRPAASGALCSITSTSNLSDVVRNQINPRLSNWGLMIDCHLPKKRIRNQFLQFTTQFLWGVYRIDEAEKESMAG